MKKQKISDAVIHRLPRYYRYLDDLYNKGDVYKRQVHAIRRQQGRIHFLDGE